MFRLPPLPACRRSSSKLLLDTAESARLSNAGVRLADEAGSVNSTANHWLGVDLLRIGRGESFFSRADNLALQETHVVRDRWC